jgi:hypothetical protein
VTHIEAHGGQGGAQGKGGGERQGGGGAGEGWLLSKGREMAVAAG